MLDTNDDESPSDFIDVVRELFLKNPHLLALEHTAPVIKLTLLWILLQETESRPGVG
jgi:hypothetical protein